MSINEAISIIESQNSPIDLSEISALNLLAIKASARALDLARSNMQLMPIEIGEIFAAKGYDRAGKADLYCATSIGFSSQRGLYYVAYPIKKSKEKMPNGELRFWLSEINQSFRKLQSNEMADTAWDLDRRCWRVNW